MASITPANGRAAFITAQDPHTYWELNSTNLGDAFGRDTSTNGAIGNAAVGAGDIATQESYDGMDVQSDPGTSSWMDTAIITDACALLYIPAGLAHGTVEGLFHNGGNTNAQGANLRGTTTGVEIICQHNNGNGNVDAVVAEIVDADLPGWFAVGWQFNSHGGAEGDMALWINGVAVASGTRVFTLDYGSGDVDFGNSSMNVATTGEILDGPTGNGNWGGATAIDGSGVLIANFTCDNPSMSGTAPSDTSAGAGNTFYTDYYDEHTAGGTDATITPATVAASASVPLPTVSDGSSPTPDFEYDFENGSDESNVLTTSPTPNFDVVNPSGNVKFDTAQSAHGSLSMRLDNETGVAEVRWYGLDTGTNRDVVGRLYVRFASVAPASSITIAQVRDTAGSVRPAGLALSTSGRIIGLDSNLAVITGTNIADHVIVADTWYRIEFGIEIGTTTGNGRFRYSIYALDSLTRINASSEFDSSTEDLGGDVDAYPERIYSGKLSSAAANGSIWMDDLAYGTGTVLYGPAGNPDATISASVVAAVAAVPLPTISAASNATVGATVVAASAAIPLPVVTGESNATVGASVVVASASIPLPTVTAQSNATVSASVVAAVTSIPLPTVDTASNATVAASVIAAVAALPAPSLSTGSTITPATVAAISAVPLPAVDTTTTATVAATVVAAVAAVPLPTITATSTASVIASVIAASASIPLPTITATSSATVAASVVAASASIPLPTVTSSATVTPGTVTAIAALPLPAVTATSSATISASVVAASAAIPLPAISAGGTATISASVIAAVASVPAPSLSTGSTITPATVAASAAVPLPTVTTAAGATATPAVIAASASVPTPTVTASTDATVTPGVIAATASVATPTVDAASNATVTPSVVAATTSVSSITFTSDATITATVIASTGAIGSITFTSDANVSPGVIAVLAAVVLPNVIAGEVDADTTIAAIFKEHGFTVTYHEPGHAATFKEPGVSVGYDERAHASVFQESTHTPT